MIRNFLLITLRNLIRHKTYSAISILGLAIGFCAFILISLNIKYEYSWDKQNEKYDRIYRVQRFFSLAVHSSYGNEISPHTRGITARLLDTGFPEFEKVLLTRPNEGMFLASEPNSQIYDEYGFCCDQVVFDVFSYNFIEGIKENALAEPFTIVLSKTLAGKLFPDKSALGKMVVIEKKYNLKVTGVYSDLPLNAEFRPSYLVSLSSLRKQKMCVLVCEGIT